MCRLLIVSVTKGKYTPAGKMVPDSGPFLLRGVMTVRVVIELLVPHYLEKASKWACWYSTLPFGITSAPKIFDAVPDTLQYIVVKWIIVECYVSTTCRI